METGPALVLQRLVESTADGILAFDTDCRYTVWNPGMERIAGVRAADVLGKIAFDVFPFLVTTGEDSFFREALAGRSVVATDREFVIPQSGRRGFFEGRYSPLHDASGRVIGGFAVIRDVTELRRDEEERLTLARADAARAEAEAAVRRFAFLAEASEALSSSLDLAATLRELARIVLPTLGDMCIVDLAGEGSLRRVAAEHVREDKRALLDELCLRCPETLDSPRPAARVLRSGVPELLEEVSADVVAAHTEGPEHAALIRAIGVRSHIAVPLVARGLTLGAISVAITESTRRYGQEDMRLALELARRAALAVDNARLHGALTLSERRFRAVADQSPLAMQMVEPSGRLVRVNQAWEKLWGVTLAEIPDYNLLADPQLEALGVTPVMRRAFAGESVEIPPTRYDPNATLRDRSRHDDPLRWVRTFAYPIKDDAGAVREVVLVQEDVTGHVRATEQLQALADAGRTLGGSLDAGLSLDELTRVVVPRLADLCAVALAGADGAHERVAVFHADADVVARTRQLFDRFPHGPFRRLADGETEWAWIVTSGMLELVARSPEHLALLRGMGFSSWVAVPLVARGVPLGVLLLAQLESGRRCSRDDVALAHDLAMRAAAAVDNERLYTQLRDEDRRKDEFLATLAHELRNPLAPIRSGLEVLRITPAGAQATEAREVMDRQVAHMVRLVDDLLDVSRVTQGKIELHSEAVDASVIVSAALEVGRPVLEARGLALDVRVPETPVVLRGDPTRLVQIVSNLLVNAAKFTPTGGHVTLEVERDGDGVVLRVRDDGIGIPKGMLAAVFEMFVQVKRPTTDGHGGLGVGLTLVRRLVELHGGRVWAESEGPGRGSTFVVRLPAGVALPGTTESRPLPPRAVRRARTILLVDDHVDGAAMLAAVLELDGHVVHRVTTAAAALEVIGDLQPDAALLDIGLPGMDGYELARRIRARSDVAGVLLVAVTGWGQAADRRRSREAGFDHHMTKPVEPEALARLLAAIARPPA